MNSDAPEEIQQQASNRVSFSLAPAGSPRLSKPIPGADMPIGIASRLIGPDGGTLVITNGNASEDGDNASEEDQLKIMFMVMPGALDGYHQITMEVYGRTLSDLEIVFEPSGLKFGVNAMLLAQVGNNLIDLTLSEVLVWHNSLDGTDEVPFGYIAREKHVAFYIAVPGFSRYSWDD